MHVSIYFMIRIVSLLFLFMIHTAERSLMDCRDVWRSAVDGEAVGLGDFVGF